MTEHQQDNWSLEYHGSAKLTISSPETGIEVRVTKNEDPLDAKQFIKIDKKSKEIKVEDSCTYFLVSINAKKETSKVIRINLTNLDEGSKLISESAPRLDPKERMYRFKNPSQKKGLMFFLKSLITHLKEDQLISNADIISVFEECITKELKE